MKASALPPCSVAEPHVFAAATLDSGILRPRSRDGHFGATSDALSLVFFNSSAFPCRLADRMICELSDLLTAQFSGIKTRERIVMRSFRVSIAGLMGAVLIAALCVAALRSASETWAGVTLLATCGVLGLAAIGVVNREVTERAWWLGFALFGWGYLALAFWSPFIATRLPTLTLLEDVFNKAGVTVADFGFRDLSFTPIAHCFWALLTAILGGMLATILFAIPLTHSERPAAETQESGHPPRKWWRRPAVIGESGIALTGTVAVVTSGLAPALWAGLTFLLTCVLLGFAILGP